MKSLTLVFIAVLWSAAAFTQQKEFEGKIVYKAEARSKQDGVSGETVLALLGRDDTLNVFIKGGNYLQESKSVRTFYINKDEKIYILFKGVDTLYSISYKRDTSKVRNIEEGSAAETLAGYDCQSLLIKTDWQTTEFVYSPSLYTNPQYVKAFAGGEYKAFVERTKSIWLANRVNALNYQWSLTAFRVEPTPVDDNLFQLPALPVKEYKQNMLIRYPEFAGKEKSWAEFLQKYTQAELAAKYLKFKKGQDTVEQVVYVGFVVPVSGDVTNVQVLNPKDVHPKLAAEAKEVISLSDWKPGIVHGKPVNFPLVQPVVFRVVRE